MDPIYEAGKANSTTTLSAVYMTTTETIEVFDGSRLPDAPNVATIADAANPAERYAVVAYLSKTGNVLSDLVVLEVVPSAPQSFPIGAVASRNVTGPEWNRIKQFMESHAAIHAADGSDPVQIHASQVNGGVFDISLIPKAALERVVRVADDTARFNLTPEDVQLGDTVHVNDTGRLYLVINTEQLGSSGGYLMYKGYPVEHAYTHGAGSTDPIQIHASQVNGGVFDISLIPKAALERVVTVANDTARFALTTAQAQLGDTVKVTDTGFMFLVVDESKLNTAAGYLQYTALPTDHASKHGSAGSDPIQINASQVTGGTLALARVPKLDNSKLPDNFLPTPGFTYARVEGAIQNTIAFTDETTAPTDAPVQSREWDFGDGSTSTETSPTHTFPSFGAYVARLAVKNKFGPAVTVQTVYVSSDPIYGYRIIDAESNPEAKIEYIDDAVGMTPCTRDATTGVWSLGSWEETINKTFRPCVLAHAAASRKFLDITNLALYEDATASPFDLENGNEADGDVMCEISHLKYVQVKREGNDILVRFCASPAGPGFIPMAHLFGDEDRKHVELGMFEGIVENNVLKSKYSLTVNPTVSKTIDTFRSYTTADKKGSETYGLVNIHTDDLHTLLSVLFLKSLFFQSKVGNGNSSSDVYLKSGEGLDLTGGCLQGDPTVTNKGVMVFWVWNKYANYWEFKDGLLKIADGEYWVNRTNKNFMTYNTTLPAEAPANHDVVKFPTPANGYARRMSGDPRCPLMTTVTGSGASSTLHYTDYFYKDVGVRVLIRGGYRGNGASCGPFYSYVYFGPAYSYTHIGARLQAFLATE